MRILLSVLLLALLVACGAPAPESEEVAATDIESAEAEDLDVEGEDEEEELELPPEGALPQSEILAKLEALGYTQIVETEFEDGVWEVEYVGDGEERELHVDPMTGETLPEEDDGESDEASSEG
jgi:ABC-type enterochelin transport system substrate-binding protein